MKIKGENHALTYTLIKLPPLTSSDKALAIGVPGHAGQTVFMGMGNFGAQLPRLVKKEIDKDSGKAEEERKVGGRETARRNIKVGVGEG